MKGNLQTFSADDCLVIAMPECALPASEREDFISFVKAEWSARQSRFGASDASELADAVDSAWWTRNRKRILAAIALS